MKLMATWTPLWIVFLAASAANAGATSPSDTWPQWGGPKRDFKSDSTGLAETWPADGPRRLWKRPLGDGYSAIVADSQRLFTCYREGDEEVVIALASDDGGTLWEYRHVATVDPPQTDDHGPGPNAAPLLLSGRIITIGFTGILHSIDAETGEVAWSHNLVEDFGGAVQYYGYSCSPLAYEETIIVPVGGEDCGVVALDAESGGVVWQSQGSAISYAAPALIDVDGQHQVVFFSPTEVIGLDPTDGALLWNHPVVNMCRVNCTSALWGDDQLLWAATKGIGGTRVLRLSQEDGETRVEELWSNPKVGVFHSNGIRLGDHVYTSIGSRATLSVIDVRTGKVVEKQPGFGSTNIVYADGKLILLDESGRLGLGKVGQGDLEILASHQLFDARAWTVPTLVGTTLYVRDRHSIVALDLSSNISASDRKR